MNHIQTTWLAASFFTAISFFATAQESQETNTGKPFKVDDRMKTALDSLQYKYEITADGDFKLICKIDETRTQVVFVNSSTEIFQGMEIREIFSPAAVSAPDGLTAPFLRKLLEDNFGKKLGAWQMISGSQSSLITFTVKTAASTPADNVNKIIWMVAHTADELEKEISPADDY